MRWTRSSPRQERPLTYGMRVTWNTNVTSGKNLFARTAGSFLDASHDNDQPLNQTILGNVHDLFPATPLFVYQPRVSFAYQLPPRLAVHGGFGVFNDIIPMQIADLAAMNAPNDPTFVGGIGGQVGGIGIAPGVAGSAVDAAANANIRSSRIFRSGGRSLRRNSAWRTDLSAGRQPEYLPERNAQDAVLLPIQFRR